MNKIRGIHQYRRAAAKINQLHRRLKSWKLVSKELGGINRGILSAIANGKRTPTPQVLRALGLPVVRMRPAPVCPKCGIVHIRKTCPPPNSDGRKRTNWKRAFKVLLMGMLARKGKQHDAA